MRGKPSISFGDVEKAIEAMKEGRYCDYNTVSNALNQWMSKANSTEQELIGEKDFGHSKTTGRCLPFWKFCRELKMV